MGFNSFTRTYIYPYWLTSDMYVNSTRGRNHIVGFNNKTNISRPIHAACINVKIFSQELCRQCSSGVLGIMSQRNDASLLPIAILGKLIALKFKSLDYIGCKYSTTVTFFCHRIKIILSHLVLMLQQPSRVTVLLEKLITDHRTLAAHHHR